MSTEYINQIMHALSSPAPPRPEWADPSSWERALFNRDSLHYQIAEKIAAGVTDEKG